MERRKALRAYLRLPVRYTTHAAATTEGSTLSKDAGSNGIGLILPEPLPKDTDITLEIRLPDDQQIVTVKGKVVWQEGLKGDGDGNRSARFITGVQFVDINQNTRSQIAEFVVRSLKQESEDANSMVRSLVDSSFTPQQRQFVFQKRAFLTDTNAEGNVYFARYFDWQGMAREDYFRHAVPDHMELMRTGTKLITVHAWIKYEHETHLFNEIVIKVRTTSLKRMTMELGFTYVNKRTAQVVAIGGQKLAFADVAGNLIPIPPSIRAGAATCLVEPESEEWHMELTKRRVSEQERLDSASKGAQEKKRR